MFFTWQAASRAEVRSVPGELVRMCVVGNGENGHGEAHLACATKCVNEGYPLAVMTADGTLYKVTGKLTAGNNASLQKLISQCVVAIGEFAEDADGKTIDATKIELATQ